MDALEKTLQERGSRYGDFSTHASIAQGLKEVMQSAPKWGGLQPDQREALEMVAHKIGRILNGDPDYADSWHDIAGYAALVEKRLAAIKESPAERVILRRDCMLNSDEQRSEYHPAVAKQIAKENKQELAFFAYDYGNGRFVKRPDGVYFIEQAKMLKLCSLLHVVAKIRNNKGEEWGRLLRWQDDDNHPHEWEAPLSLLKVKNGERVRMELARQGAYIPTSAKERSLLREYLLNWPVD
jgi:hypothetical protein